jgi:cytochrome c oxidase subunit 4
MSSSEHAHGGGGHVSPVSLYITIFLALMVLTAATVGAAYINLGSFNFPVAMVIAIFKASLVVWFFMHVKYQSHLTKLTLATGLFFLAILLGMMLIDYSSKSFLPMPPQTDSMGEIGHTK